MARQKKETSSSFYSKYSNSKKKLSKEKTNMCVSGENIEENTLYDILWQFKNVKYFTDFRKVERISGLHYIHLYLIT